MKNLILRSVTGLVYVCLIVGAVLLGGWWFAALVCLFTILGLVEFYGLTKAADASDNPASMVVDVAGGMVLAMGLSTLNVADLSAFTSKVLGATFFLLYLVYLLARLVMQLYSRDGSPINSIANSFMGQMYIALPLGLLTMFYTLPDGKALLLAMFVMIWLNDTGAFIVGSLMGRHPMMPRISPKKSMEGLAGGFMFSIGSAFVMKYGFGQWFESMDIWALAVMGIVVSGFATWGDLVESMIKRTLGVKDSGKLMPGHGGILDRIDSLLLVGPATLLYLVALRLF